MSSRSRAGLRANSLSPANDPMDMGFMYARSFQDPDRRQWEVVWMDPSALEQLPAEAGATAA
jgi:predicted lactoylglutathione lyase